MAAPRFVTLALALALLAPRTAVAQDPGTQPPSPPPAAPPPDAPGPGPAAPPDIALDALKDPEALSRRGQVRLDAKLKKVFGQTIYLRTPGAGFDISVTFKIVDQASQKIAVTLTEEVDNVRIAGSVKRDESRWVFEIERLERLPRDDEAFEARYATLAAAGDATGLYALGQATVARGEAYQDRKLPDLAKKAFKAGIQAEEKGLAEKDVDGLARLAERYVRLLGDKRTAIETLDRCLRISHDHRPARELLRELNAVRYRGKWWLYDDYKQEEGFVQVGGKWVSKQRQDLLEAIAKFKKTPTRLLPFDEKAEYWEELVRAHLVELGMPKKLVVRSLGFPDWVDRVVEPDGSIYEQWCYEERGCHILRNGILITKWE